MPFRRGSKAPAQQRAVAPQPAVAEAPAPPPRTSLDFAEGERVLCYEPDPTKIRVVYDAKIVAIEDGDADDEIPSTSEESGPRFLIHFAGWNSSWDRYVTAPFLLKDTPENRELQRQLFVESEQAKKKYRKRKDSTGGGTTASTPVGTKAKRKEKEKENENDPVGEANTAEAMPEVWSNNADAPPNDDEDDLGAESVSVELPLPDVLRDQLERDHARVLANVEAVPACAACSVLSVLEAFVRHYAAWRLRAYDRLVGKSVYAVAAARHPVDADEQLQHAVDAIEICKQVAEGLRICVDFYTDTVLLYSSEKDHHAALLASGPRSEPECPRQRKRTDSSEYNHSGSEDGAVPAVVVDKRLFRGGVAAQTNHTSSCSTISMGSGSGRSTPLAAVSSVSTGSRPRGRPAKGSVPTSKTSNKILSEIDGWRLVPDNSKTCTLPSMVYGPQMLLRLLLRLPEILSRMRMAPRNAKLIAKYLESLVEFLTDRTELFD